MLQRRLYCFALTLALVAAPFARPAGAQPAVHAIIPPENPARNYFAPSATSFDQPLLVVDGARRVLEGLAPLPLVAGVLQRWRHLTPIEAAFALTNLERISRGLTPAAGLSVPLDGVALAGARHDTDPSVQPLGSLSPLGSVWAQALGPTSSDALLHADAGWLYSDGPPPYDSSLAYNIDCPRAGDSGCWGHRDILLGVDPTSTLRGNCAHPQLYLGVGYIPGSETQILASACPANVGALVDTWPHLVTRLGLGPSWVAPLRPYHARVVADYFVSCHMSSTSPPDAPGALRVKMVEVLPGGTRSTSTFGDGVTWYISVSGSPATQTWTARLTYDPSSGAPLPSPLTVRWVHGSVSVGIHHGAPGASSGCFD